MDKKIRLKKIKEERNYLNEEKNQNEIISKKLKQIYKTLLKLKTFLF